MCREASFKSDNDKAFPTYTRNEVAQHCSFDDAWIIYENGVYDISSFGKRHPGGSYIYYFRGDDATEAIHGFHCDMETTMKYMKSCQVGVLSKDEGDEVDAVIRDFRELRKQLEQEGRFKPNPIFYLMHLGSLFLMEAVAVALMWQWGGSDSSSVAVKVAATLVAALVLATSQAQAGWLQHDFGHCAVFRRRWMNQWVHYFVIGCMKGASSWWWKIRHNRHHSKTNTLGMDPDLRVEPLFSFSDIVVKEGRPFVNPMLRFQHWYWWFLGPPITTTLYFLSENILFMARRPVLGDVAAVMTFYLRFDLVYRCLLGLSFSQVLALWFLMRFFESHWFTWVTQMNHIPMPIVPATTTPGDDSGADGGAASPKKKPPNWVEQQLAGTLNVTPGPFYDWFTGHLNYQIEHHLFPNMPRHNYPHVAERCRHLCNTHGIPYVSMPIWQSWKEIVHVLTKVAHVADDHHISKKLS